MLTNTQKEQVVEQTLQICRSLGIVIANDEGGLARAQIAAALIVANGFQLISDIGPNIELSLGQLANSIRIK